jgi:hypothetical protein
MLTPWEATPPSEQCLIRFPTAPKAATESEQRRYVLPKNLRNAVKHLSDGELELMYAATLEELKHRGKTPRSAETNLPARSDLTKVRSPPTKTAKLKAQRTFH